MNHPLAKNKSKIYISVFIFGVVFLIIFIFYATFDIVYANRVMPGVKFGSEILGSMDSSVARNIVYDLLDEQAKQKLIFIHNDMSAMYSLSDLGIDFDYYASNEAVKRFGRGDNFLINLFQRVRGLLCNVSVMASYYNSSAWDQAVLELENQIDVEPVPARVVIKPDKFRAEIVPAVVGYKLNKELFNKIVKSHLGKLKFNPIELPIASYSPVLDTKLAQITAQKINQQLGNKYLLKFKDQSFELTGNDLWDWLEVADANNTFVVRLQEAEVVNYVKSLEQSINQPMQNAVFEIKNGQVIKFLPHQSGALLRTKEATELIQAALLDPVKEIELPVNYLEPKITLKQINNLGINRLVARGVSNFAGSPTNRRHNITIGAERFDNILIEPGITFSINEQLGQVDASTGYLPELVIKGDETTPEYGGGLCQVSTTAFRAILNGGYPIIERKNHSYRVAYYEPAGSDATIYPPYPDLKFTNDTSNYILIDTYIKGDNLYFDFYSTLTSRRVEIEGPRIYKVTDYPEPVYIETSAIEDGTVKQIDSAHRGADAMLYRYIYNEKGQQIRKDEFYSHYIPWPAKYLVGVKEAPTLDTDLDNILPDFSTSEEAMVNIDLKLNPEE